MSHLDLLISGYRSFRADFFARNQSKYRKLVREGQQPKICMIACADSRVDPAIVMQIEPGEVFTIRNVANLVPPYEEQGTYHGVSAALEFAVKILKVEDVLVLGHANCGGIKALMTKDEFPVSNDRFITAWMGIAEEAIHRVDAQGKDMSDEERTQACEQSAILVSLDNLMTFPMIKRRVEEGSLRLTGWHYDLSEGQLRQFNPETKTFEDL